MESSICNSFSCITSCDAFREYERKKQNAFGCLNDKAKNMAITASIIYNRMDGMYRMFNDAYSSPSERVLNAFMEAAVCDSLICDFKKDFSLSNEETSKKLQSISDYLIKNGLSGLPTYYDANNNLITPTINDVINNMKKIMDMGIKLRKSIKKVEQ